MDAAAAFRAHWNRSIEGRLEQYRQMAMNGFPTDTPETKLVIKAFRLKHFGRCPACDDGVTVWYDNKDMATHTKCRCGFHGQMVDFEVIRAGHTDDVLIDMCRPYVDGAQIPKEA